MTPYKQRYAVVMETGEIEVFTVYGEDSSHGVGLAIEEAVEKFGCQVWDVANVPVGEFD